MKKLVFNIITCAALSSSTSLVFAQNNVNACSKLSPGYSGGLAGFQWRRMAIAIDIANIPADGVTKAYTSRLSATVKEWNNPACVSDDGLSQLNALDGGIERAFRTPLPGKNSLDWDASYKRVEKFKREANDEPLATLIEAKYWTTYAWNARGGGYASSVTPEGWSLFKKRLEIAESILLKNKNTASTIPTWYSMMIQTQSELGRPLRDRESIFMEGAKKYPEFSMLYADYLTYLTPKWGGTWKKCDEVIIWATTNSKHLMGQATYSQLYGWLRYYMPDGQSIFKETAAKWPRMKLGYEELIRRYPASQSNLNEFAAVACEAGDKKTYLHLRKRLTNNDEMDKWTKSYPIELCDAKYGFNQ